ncbi:hypothetical protein AKO1_000791 [Acrasis kona]|uniref:Uncharacterized protein n=1 Tax=Acrasis kona TaxID=1008807 RepID=A0AAW2ZFF1_9EUKA
MTLSYGGAIHKKKINLLGRAWDVGIYCILDVNSKTVVEASKLESNKTQDRNKSPIKQGQRTKQVKAEEEEAFVEENVINKPLAPLFIHEDEEAFLFEDPFASIRQAQTKSKQELEYAFCNVKLGETHTIVLEIGLTKSKQSSTTVKTDYVFDSLSDQDISNGFSIDPSKGTLESGSKKSINIKFCPTQATIDQVQIEGIDAWIETTLKCTAKDPYTNNPYELVIYLRGQVLTQ